MEAALPNEEQRSVLSQEISIPPGKMSPRRFISYQHETKAVRTADRTRMENRERENEQRHLSKQLPTAFCTCNHTISGRLSWPFTRRWNGVIFTASSYSRCSAATPSTGSKVSAVDEEERGRTRNKWLARCTSGFLFFLCFVLAWNGIFESYGGTIVEKVLQYIIGIEFISVDIYLVYCSIF